MIHESSKIDWTQYAVTVSARLICSATQRDLRQKADKRCVFSGAESCFLHTWDGMWCTWHEPWTACDQLSQPWGDGGRHYRRGTQKTCSPSLIILSQLWHSLSIILTQLVAPLELIINGIWKQKAASRFNSHRIVIVTYVGEKKVKVKFNNNNNRSNLFIKMDFESRFKAKMVIEWKVESAKKTFQCSINNIKKTIYYLKKQNK